MLDMGEAEADIEAEAPEEEAPVEVEEEDVEGSPAGDFESFADVALDTTLPMAERRAALKEAIMACMGSDYSEDSETGEGSSLATIFGGS